MGMIYTRLPSSTVHRIRHMDREYLRKKLEVKCLLNSILNKSINKSLLKELLHILDNEPVPRQHREQFERKSKVKVFSNGMLIRIEHSNGKVMKEMRR